MRPPARDGSGRGIEELHGAIEQFLTGSHSPVLLEPGEQPIPIGPKTFHLESLNGRLTLQAWTESRNLVRRVTGITLSKPGRLELEIEKFGKRKGELILLDQARPQNQSTSKKLARSTGREILRRLSSRAFPGWTTGEITSEQDLEHSFSPVYPRALLRKGPAGIAAMLAPADSPGGVLTFALLWFDYLRRRERRIAIDTLAVFLPAGSERTTCLRLRYIGCPGARFLAFSYSPEEHCQAIDLTDFGNVETIVPPLHGQNSDVDSDTDHAISQISRMVDGVESVPLPSGRVLRVRGLEFARRTASGWRYGIETKRPVTASNLTEVIALAREISRLRSSDAADHHNPVCARAPELWLESQVRRSVQQIDAGLLPEPIYGQVPALAAATRGIIDLLASTADGRLSVLELKASEDIHLPMQALDYWLRVCWHLERGEFTRGGYFPGITLQSDPPKLMLIAPSLDFHPTTETLLGYFHPSIDVHKIGLAGDWRHAVSVMFHSGRTNPSAVEPRGGQFR
jgi:hypothetical protein